MIEIYEKSAWFGDFFFNFRQKFYFILHFYAKSIL